MKPLAEMSEPTEEEKLLCAEIVRRIDMARVVAGEERFKDFLLVIGPKTGGVLQKLSWVPESRSKPYYMGVRVVFVKTDMAGGFDLVT